MKKNLIENRIEDCLFPTIEQDLKNLIEELQKIYSENIENDSYLKFVDIAVSGYGPVYVLHKYIVPKDRK